MSSFKPALIFCLSLTLIASLAHAEPKTEKVGNVAIVERTYELDAKACLTQTVEKSKVQSTGLSVDTAAAQVNCTVSEPFASKNFELLGAANGLQPAAAVEHTMEDKIGETKVFCFGTFKASPESYTLKVSLSNWSNSPKEKTAEVLAAGRAVLEKCYTSFAQKLAQQEQDRKIRLLVLQKD